MNDKGYIYGFDFVGFAIKGEVHPEHISRITGLDMHPDAVKERNFIIYLLDKCGQIYAC